MSGLRVLVRWVGVEPTRLAAHGPQPCLSANSSTSARFHPESLLGNAAPVSGGDFAVL